MSASFNNIADSLTIGSDLPDGVTFTVCGWAYRTSDAGDYSNFFGYEGNTSTENALIQFGSGGDVVEIFYRLGGGSGVGDTVGTPSHPGWFFWAMTVNVDDIDGYMAEPGDTSFSTGSASLGTNDGDLDDHLILGNDQHDEFLNGLIANVKLWSGVVLTQAELWNEMQTFRPHRFANLHLWTPLLAHDDLVDYSGNGRDWTANGNIETDAQPPISWGMGTLVAPNVVAGSVSVTPGTSEVVLTGFEPTVAVTAHVSAAPGVSEVALTGYEPTAAATAHVSATPGVSQTLLAGFEPTAVLSDNQKAEPGASEVVLTGFEPTVLATAHVWVTPGLSEIAITGFEPTAVATEHVWVTPDVSEVVLTGYEPTIVASDHQVVAPGLGEIVITGFQPIASASSGVWVTPGLCEIIINGFAPTVFATEIEKAPSRYFRERIRGGG